MIDIIATTALVIFYFFAGFTVWATHDSFGEYDLDRRPWISFVFTIFIWPLFLPFFLFSRR